MKAINCKFNKINIIISLIVSFCGMAIFVYSFFQDISILHLIFAIINIVWLFFECFIIIKNKKSKKHKILYLILFSWCLLLSVNIIFIYFNVFLVYAIYSSAFLLLILVLLYEIARPWAKSTLFDSFGSLPLGLIVLTLSLIPLIIIFDTVKDIKRNKKKHKENQT